MEPPLADADERALRRRALPDAGIAIRTPGALATQLLDEVPEVVVLAVRHLAHRRADPPRTPVEITHDLAVHPSMAAPTRRLRRYLR